jgi:hypothetical protein
LTESCCAGLEAFLATRDNIYIARQRHISTRGGSENALDGGTILGVTIVIGGGGGGSGGTTPPTPPTPHSSIIEVDCDAQAAANSSAVMSRLTNFRSAGFTDFVNNYQNVDVEYGYALNYINGNYVPGQIRTDNLSDYVGIQITQNITVATAHNHPTNNPPSIYDAWSLASYNSDPNFSNYKTNYVILPNGNIYALYIEDAAKAHTFAHNHTEEELIGEFLYHYSEISLWCQGITAEERHMYATTMVLSSCNSGIVMIKKETNGFRQKGVELNVPLTWPPIPHYTLTTINFNYEKDFFIANYYSLVGCFATQKME